MNRFQIREEPPPYSSPAKQRSESFDNPLAGSRSFESDDDERASSVNSGSGTALYDFTAGGDDEVNLVFTCTTHNFVGHIFMSPLFLMQS